MKQFCMKNRSYFPGERKCIVLALQHGGNDVTCSIVSSTLVFNVLTYSLLKGRS